MNATPTPFTDVPERISQLIWVLCQVVSERCSLRVHTLTGEQVKYICERLLAARKRFRNVVARIQAGKPPKVRARKPRVRKVRPRRPTLAELARDLGAMPRGWRLSARQDRARERAMRKAAREAAAAGKPVPLWRALRMHVPGWLFGCAPAIYQYPGSAASCAIEFRRLLAEPEMQALLLSHPYVGDALSSVAHGLGMEQSLLHRRPTVLAAPAPDPSAEPAGEIIPRPQPSAAPTAPTAPTAADENHVSRPAAKRPPAKPAPIAPTPRTAPRSGVVIIDYWDLR